MDRENRAAGVKLTANLRPRGLKPAARVVVEVVGRVIDPASLYGPPRYVPFRYLSRNFT